MPHSSFIHRATLPVLVVLTVTVVTTARGQTQAMGDPPALRALNMLPGIVEPVARVDVAASQDGVLAKLCVEEGQLVQQGDLLAVLDDRVAQAALHVAEATVARSGALGKAESDLALARIMLSRVEQARAERAASEMEVDQARGRVSEAEAAVTQAREQQAEAESHLELELAKFEALHVRAPFAGQVLRIHVQAGGALPPAAKILTLVQVDRLRVELQVPVEWYGRLAVGAAYDLWAETPVNRAVSARLLYQESAVDAATQSFRCVLEIDNAAGELPSGFAARLIEPEQTAGLNRPADWIASNTLSPRSMTGGSSRGPAQPLLRAHLEASVLKTAREFARLTGPDLVCSP